MRNVRPSAILAVVAACLPWSAPSLSPIGDAFAATRVTAVPPAQYRSQTAAHKSVDLLATTSDARRVVLSEPTADEIASLASYNAARSTKRFGRPDRAKSPAIAVGFPRALPADARSIVLSDLRWRDAPDGSRVARVEITSPGAAAVRLSLALPASHPDLTLRFAGSAARAEVVGPFAANAISSGADRDGMFVTPVLEGDTAIVELHAANGATFDGLAIVIGPLSHIVVSGDSLHKADKVVADHGRAGACNVDVACVQPSSVALAQAADSVGKIVYNDRFGRTLMCTGTLLNDSIRSFTPYLLAAEHCITDAFRASTVNVYWFFRAQACGSAAVPTYRLQTGGAMLLGRSIDMDWALLRLNTAPPDGVFFSAWRAEPVPPGAIAVSLHHPHGDVQKFNEGTVTGYHVESDGSSFIDVVWNRGVTENGSSGSPLLTFLAGAGYYEVRGALWGGESSCSAPTAPDYFSRLDTMLPVTRQYLTPDAPRSNGEVVAVEFYHRDLDHYFITTDAHEINLLDTGELRGWERTGLRFLVSDQPLPGTRPVCRFYLRPEVGDSHFYSADADECARTRERFGASWIHESPSVFHVALPDAVTGACPAATRPVWRFFNTATTNHRYTTEVWIRDELRNDPRWLAEGYGPDSVIMCALVGS